MSAGPCRELLATVYPFFGAKPDAVVELTWQALGDVPNYVEPFFGSGRILLGRPQPGKAETARQKLQMKPLRSLTVSTDPHAVAAACDRPVNECDLVAIHRHLVAQAADLVARLQADPRFFEPELAGWWAWGASCWIGSGWCVESRAKSSNALPHLTRDREGKPGGGQGVHKSSMQTLPRVGGCDGTGVSYGAGINVRDRRDRLVEWFLALAARMRHVRVCTGDFARVLSPAVTTGHGLTGVVLDPPYAKAARALGLYVDDAPPESPEEKEAAVRARDWAIEHGDHPLLRVVYYGYEDGFAWPPSWRCHAWKAGGGYGNQAQGRGRANASRERIWFSPHCFPVDRQPSLFG